MRIKTYLVSYPVAVGLFSALHEALTTNRSYPGLVCDNILQGVLSDR